MHAQDDIDRYLSRNVPTSEHRSGVAFVLDPRTTLAVVPLYACIRCNTSLAAAFCRATWCVQCVLTVARLFRPLSCCSRGAHSFAELDLGSEVQRLAGPLPPLQFHRDFVSTNKPCVLTGSGSQQWCTTFSALQQKLRTQLQLLCAGAIESWPALSRWNQQYFKDKLHDKQVQPGNELHRVLGTIAYSVAWCR